VSTTTSAEGRQKGGVRVAVQRFGTFLSSMIMPNIGAFIAWGAITALFVYPKGPFANEQINTLVGATVTYLLPILIAYSGGRLIHGVRGGVVGSVAVMGVILGTSSPVFIGEDGVGAPMFLGAMIMGPIAAWVMKKLDALWAGKVKPGFEMLVDNFSAGIVAAILAIGSMFLLTPVMNFLTHIAGVAVGFLIDHGLLPLTSILIEPAKVLFLNNAINHGIITPLATEQSLEQGKSILFLLEANPGPGFGILLAYMFFGRGVSRATAPGAAIIQFFGGIHEIYFPYVLMKPVLIVAAIAGGMSGVFVELLFDAGLRSPAAPGSIIMVLLSTANDSYVGVILGVLAATVVSCVVASAILKFSKQSEDDLAKATAQMEGMKGKKSSVSSFLTGEDGQAGGAQISKIVFACDAGMGSSAMGASVLRNKIKKAGYGDQVSVVNSAINNLTDEFDLVVVHEDLYDRAKDPTPSAAHVTVDNFMGSPRYDEIVETIRRQREGGTAGSGAEAPAETAGETEAQEGSATEGILTADSIVLGGKASDRDAAIDEAGGLLIATGKVEDAYLAAMHERESSVSTFMGNGLAIPHGTNEAKSAIHSSAVSLVRYDEEIDWNGKPVRFVIGIAGAGGEHLELLQKIAKVFSDKEAVARLEQAGSAEEVLEIFGKVNA
jgi:PTS system mannitol-specific IIC component